MSQTTKQTEKQPVWCITTIQIPALHKTTTIYTPKTEVIYQ